MTEYELIRKRIKNIYLRVTTDGRVVVTAPKYASKMQIDAFVASKEAWIKKRIAYGEDHPKRTEFTKEERLALKEKIVAYVVKWSEITGLYPTSVNIHSMTTRWGSCNKQTRRINFALQLVDTKGEFIEYVVLHELCHIAVANHGPEFKALLDRYMPDWRERKKRNK